jgi:hypothetical protein
VRITRLAPIPIVLALTACGTPPPAEPPAPAAPPESVAAVRGFREAFERHEVAAMLDHVTDDVEWLAVRGETVAVEARGREELRAWIERYVASLPGVQSIMEESFDVGSFVAVRERVTWRDHDGAVHTQIALAVYEVEAGKIRRVWYYPEQADVSR